MKNQSIVLKGTLNIQACQVQLKLRKREKNHPFVSVLMLARENQHYLFPEVVKTQLLPALPLKASTNLLDRLTRESYFNRSEEEYILTQLGIKSAENQEVWQAEEGIYNLYWVESPLVPQKIVHLEQVQGREVINQGKKGEGPQAKRLPKGIQELAEQRIEVGNEVYEFEELEENMFFLGNLSRDLTITAEAFKTSLRLQAKRNKPSFIVNREITDSFPFAQIREELLNQYAGTDYEAQHDWITTQFNSKQLGFERDVRIDAPLIAGHQFQSVILKQVRHQPSSTEDGQAWFFALLTTRLREYIFEEEAFTALQEEIGSSFLSCKPNRVSRQDMIQLLQKQGDAFYALAKLQAPLQLS